MANEEPEDRLGVALGVGVGAEGARAGALSLELGLEVGERRVAPEAHRARQPQTRSRALRELVDLSLVLHLQAILDAAQEQIRVPQRLGRLGRQHVRLGESRQRALRGAVAQLGNATAVQQLQRLRDELDVADPARIELHVEAVVAGGAPLFADPPLERANAPHARVVHRRAVDHRVDRAHGTPAEFESPATGRAFMKATFSQWSAAFS